MLVTDFQRLSPKSENVRQNLKIATGFNMPQTSVLSNRQGQLQHQLEFQLHFPTTSKPKLNVGDKDDRIGLQHRFSPLFYLEKLKKGTYLIYIL